MGAPVRAVYKARLESALPRRLFICRCSATRAVPVLFADRRGGIFWVAARADVYSLSSGGKSALRDSHRFGRKSDNRQTSVKRINEFHTSMTTQEETGAIAQVATGASHASSRWKWVLYAAAGIALVLVLKYFHVQDWLKGALEWIGKLGPWGPMIFVG